MFVCLFVCFFQALNMLKLRLFLLLQDRSKFVTTYSSPFIVRCKENNKTQWRFLNGKSIFLTICRRLQEDYLSSNNEPLSMSDSLVPGAIYSVLQHGERLASCNCIV